MIKPLKIIVAGLSLWCTPLHAQTVPVYKTLLATELKTAFVYKVFKADFNGDHKTDYGIIVENKRTRDLELFVIYSDKDSYTKQDLGSLSDKMDLTVHKCASNEQCFGRKMPAGYDGIAVECNGYNELFLFDAKLNKIKSVYRQDIGP